MALSAAPRLQDYGRLRPFMFFTGVVWPLVTGGRVRPLVERLRASRNEFGVIAVFILLGMVAQVVVSLVLAATTDALCVVL